MVVHVSSQAAYQPVPYMAVHAARSKALFTHFSLALHEEQRAHGVVVQTLVPAPTATEFDSKAGAYDSGVQKRGKADDVARASLAALDRGAPLATNAKGLWQQRLFASLAPPSMVLREVAKMFNSIPLRTKRDRCRIRRPGRGDCFQKRVAAGKGTGEPGHAGAPIIVVKVRNIRYG